MTDEVTLITACASHGERTWFRKMRKCTVASLQQVARFTHLRIENVAVLTDFSENADTALQYAAALARVHKANLLIAHAYLPPSCAYAAPEAGLVLQAFEDRRKDLEDRLLKQTESTELRDLECRVLTLVGGPEDLLEELQNVDLIVVGTSGHTGAGRAVLGSTAETIFRSSKVPVMTVGPFCPQRAPSTTALDTVLYATDLSAGAAIALPYAVSIAGEQNAKLVLLHVLEDQNIPFPFERAMASAEPLEKLHRLIPDDIELEHKPEYVIGFGMLDKVILEEAANHHTELIVMGVKGSGAFGSIATHFFGGTAYSVAVNAHCPVLTIREK